MTAKVRKYPDWYWNVPWEYRDQTAFIARQASLPYFEYRATAPQGFNGTKGVAILSRFPLTDTWIRMVELDGRRTTFGTLHATIRIGDLDHEVFSTRFAPMHCPGHRAYDPEHAPGNRNGHLQAVDMVRGVHPARAVIFGGDLNANFVAWWSKQFHDTSGLTEVLLEVGDPPPASDRICPEPERPARVDFIYYRGPYSVSSAVRRDGRGEPPPSDHPYILTELACKPEPPGCAALRQTERFQQQEVDRLQEELSRAEASERPEILKQLREARAALASTQERLRVLGC